MTSFRTAVVVVTALAASCVPAAAQASRPRTKAPVLRITAGSIKTMEGPDVAGGFVQIVDGKIRAVGVRGQEPQVPPVDEALDFPGAVAMPGFVDAGSYEGVRRERDETTAPLLPEHRILDAYDPARPGAARNFAAGITTVHLVPGDRDVVGGRTAVVKPDDRGGYATLRTEAALKVSLSSSDYPGDRAPTSPLGGVEALRRPDADVARGLAPFTQGKAPVFVAARADRDVRLASGLKSDFPGGVVLCTDVRSGREAPAVKGAFAGVVLDPFGPGRQEFERRACVSWFSSGAPVAFATYAPLAPPSALLVSAASAAAFGVDAARVERALTIDAARILGVADRVGSLKPGKDGDVVVLSLPPSDPRARILLCVQDGRVLYRAPKD